MAAIIQLPIHAARHFVVIELVWNPEVVPLTGYESNYEEMIAWCSKNILNKWYSGKMQQTIDIKKQFNKNRLPGIEDVADLAIFNFEDPNDKAHFILKWL